MLRAVSLIAVCSLISVAGCEQSPADKKADAVRDASQGQADAVRKDTQGQAEAIRDASGKTITGAAKNPADEKAADNVEKAGEQKADAIEKAGEKQADTIEKTEK